MATTYTYTPQMSNQPKKPHTGVESIPVDMLIGGSNKVGSISDVVLLGKVPNGACITDWYFNITTAAESAVYSLVLFATESAGTFSVYATLEATITTSATAAVTSIGYRPVKVSLSDDRAVQHVTLALNCTAGVSGTVSTSIYGQLRYKADGTALA